MENNALPEFERANVGDFVKFGRYPQESGTEPQPVEWQVLSKENGQMLVISRYCLDARRFDVSSNDWGKSEIRKWLNGKFYKSTFSGEEKARITRIKSFNHDNVFLLSDEEAEKYLNRDARKCKPTSYAKAKGAWIGKNVFGCCAALSILLLLVIGYAWTWNNAYGCGCCVAVSVLLLLVIRLAWTCNNDCGSWWLRSPNPLNCNTVYNVDCDGDVTTSNVDRYDRCARPALWINLESDFIKFGRYPQESGNESQPVEWQVLSKENGQMLVISRYGLDAKRFDGSSNNWGNSEIRKWLNSEFYTGSFTAEEKARIISFNQDNVFLLSYEEAEKYFSDDDARKCKPTSYAKAEGAWTADNGCGNWWLRSPNPASSNNVYIVRYVGDFGFYNNGVNISSGSVRPALWISLES